MQEGCLPVASSRRLARETLLGVLASWPARAVAAIEAGAWPSFPRRPESEAGEPRAVRRPAGALGQAARELRRAWRRATCFDTWNVGVVALERPLTRIEDLSLAGDVRWLPAAPPLGFIADPFTYREAGRDWLLVEECSHRRSRRGRISRLDLAVFAPALELQPAIERAGHLSYPFVFEDGGRTWCAPEMSSEGGCVLYRLEPDGAWRPVHRVLDGWRPVDPTFFRSGGRWWIFFTSHTGSSANAALHACWAEDLAGPWRAHRLDPLKWDLATARPAGPPFELDGRLYRPAQDCRSTYGAAVQLMEIVELTPERFREEAALRLAPDPRWPYPDGLHHLVVERDRIVFDAKRTRQDRWLWLKTALG
jgi:hypothetical protein